MLDSIMIFVNSLPGAVAQGLIWGIMAIGVYITYRILHFADLSVDGSFVTGGAVCVMLMLNGWNVWFAMLMSLLAGMAAGFLTGFFHTVLGIPDILSGILTQLSLYSINMAIMMERSNVPVASASGLLISSREVNDPRNWWQPVLILVAVVAVVICIIYWFFGTEIGCGIRATGCNENMARAQGINTSVSKMLGLIISNGIVAFAGALFSQYTGASDVNAGRGAIVIGLAAVIIGEVVLGNFFNNFACKLGSVVVGGILYYIVITFVIQLGLSTLYLKLLSAVVVAIFLAVPYVKGRYFKKNSAKMIKRLRNENGGDQNA